MLGSFTATFSFATPVTQRSRWPTSNSYLAAGSAADEPSESGADAAAVDGLGWSDDSIARCAAGTASLPRHR